MSKPPILSSNSRKLPSFQTLVERVGRDPNKIPTRLLSLDPGHTTGWCFFLNHHPHSCGQLPSTDKHPEKLIPLIDRLLPLDLILYEEFVLYPWATRAQSWSEIPTLQIIGVLKHLAFLRSIPTHGQGANVGKGFVTDAKLKAWGFYQPTRSLPHARDALRHGCHYLIFGSRKSKTKQL